MLGRNGDPHASVDVEVQPFDGERLLHCRNQLARRQFCAALRDPG